MPSYKNPEQFKKYNGQLNSTTKSDCLSNGKMLIMPLFGFMLSNSTIDIMIYVLKKWVSMRTVSGNPQYLEECRRGAKFFKNILQQLGATSQLVI